MKCVKIGECPRAIILGCNKCRSFVIKDRYKQLKHKDLNIFKGFILGVVFTVILFCVIAYI